MAASHWPESEFRYHHIECALNRDGTLDTRTERGSLSSQDIGSVEASWIRQRKMTIRGP